MKALITIIVLLLSSCSTQYQTVVKVEDTDLVRRGHQYVKVTTENGYIYLCQKRYKVGDSIKVK